ncbi:MAG: hypothetical protein QOH31_2164 [Verrucomicrobiota bacterium]
MITVPAGIRVLVATKPVDFRKGGDGLAALGARGARRGSVLGDDLRFSGPKSKRADRVKILAWDGSGLVLFWKRLEHGAFRWPPISDGIMRLTVTASQLAALVDGMDWSRLAAPSTKLVNLWPPSLLVERSAAHAQGMSSSRREAAQSCTSIRRWCAIRVPVRECEKSLRSAERSHSKPRLIHYF